MTKKNLVCCYCGKNAEGNYSIHKNRDLTGKELPLCDKCGGYRIPTLDDIWTKLEMEDEQ